MYKKILVAIDFEDENSKIIDQTIEFAKAFNSEICLAHIIEVSTFDISMEIGRSTVFVAEDESTALEQLNEFKSKIEQHGISEVESKVCLSTNVSHTLTFDLYEKWNYDLIICGVTEKHGLEKLLSGSITKDILREVKTCMLVVK